MKYDYLVVGAGFAGAVCAEQLAGAGHSVLVIDQRDHIAGNAYDHEDAHGVRVHDYGPHIFHTNSARIFEYLSRFTDWRPYEHRVLADIGDRLTPFPINRTTLNQVFGLDLDEAGAAKFLEDSRVAIDPILTSEDLVLSSVGPELCEIFFRGYTRKQWGLDLSDLSVGVAARIPTRTNDDDRYFTDEFQAMPAEGYTAMFEKMLASERIEVRLGVDFFAVRDDIDYGHLIYTGPIDRFFDYRYGKLPYRSLEFTHEHVADVETLQPVGTVNYPLHHDYTRITEFKHLTGQVHPGTSIVREYPRAEGDPYYPIPRPENEAQFRRYKTDAQAEPGVTFVGRLAEYRYYNMDQVVGSALATAQQLLKPVEATV